MLQFLIEPAKKMTRLEEFVTSAPAIIEEMSSDAREVYRSFLQAMEEIKNKLSGHCKNDTMEASLIDALALLFGLHARVCLHKWCIVQYLFTIHRLLLCSLANNDDNNSDAAAAAVDNRSRALPS
jgi:hypothetical protein